MKEKFKNLLKNEKLRAVSKKVFTKKKVGAAIVVIALLVAFGLGRMDSSRVSGQFERGARLAQGQQQPQRRQQMQGQNGQNKPAENPGQGSVDGTSSASVGQGTGNDQNGGAGRK